MGRPRPTMMRPTTARGPRVGVVASVLLHAGIVAAAFITFQHSFQPPEESHAVPVDLVTIAPQTNVAAMAPPQPAPPPKVTPPVEEMTPPPLPQFADAEPAPDIAPPKIKIEEPKPTPKKSSQDFAALLNKLTAPDKTQKNVKAGSRVIRGIGAANAMTADLSDALKSQIYRCWSPPVGAPNANDLVVDFDVRLNPDGSVGGVQLNTLSASGNPYTRAAAEAASRAIYQCQPYRLPPDRYSQWREINPLRFDPRQMMEQ
jgi:hypothetical protein